MSAYPTSFPLVESVELVQIVRQNQIKEKKAVFARHLWTLQGFAMKSLVGDPDAPAVAPTPAPAPLPTGPAPAPASPANPPLLPPIFGDLGIFSAQSVEEFRPTALDELEKLNAYHSGKPVVQDNIPWAMILKWALQELAVVLAS